MLRPLRSSCVPPAEPRRFAWLAGYEPIVAAYVLLGLVLASTHGFTIDFELLLDVSVDAYFLAILAAFLMLSLAFTGLRARWTEPDRTPFGPAWRARVRREHLTAQRAWDFVRAFAMLKLMLVVYSALKQSIPRMNPVLYDEQLLEAELLLHLGWNPMTWLAETFQGTAFVWFMDRLYVTWYLVKAPVLAVFILTRDRALHARFFSAYFLVWILGGLSAVLLPSLGPVYLHPEWFAELEMPIARLLQGELWSHYEQLLAAPEQYQVMIYQGIAAFPSVHVAAVALFTIFLHRVHPALGWMMGGYAALILVGSVLLGWHYAIDGWFGILLAWALAWLVGRRWWRRSAV
jgi:hypothetical protein